MSLLEVLSEHEIRTHIADALKKARCDDLPYRHWLLNDVLPERLALNLIALPIAPLLIDDCHGVRDTQNDKRTFITPRLQAQFPVCATFAEAMQASALASLFRNVLAIEAEGSYLRMEYIQDLDGAWLEPHRDVPEKLFSMVIYLCTGPEAQNWGTDIYDHNKRWWGRSSAAFNTAVIFVPGVHTWHGFDKRPIHGVRRLFEINYVHRSWRDKDQLCFPDRPITMKALETMRAGA